LTLCASGRIAEGVTETVLRSDITAKSGPGLSLMPEGFRKSRQYRANGGLDFVPALATIASFK